MDAVVVVTGIVDVGRFVDWVTDMDDGIVAEVDNVD